ncbi:MAG: hypothetical protein JWQ40_460 [Segetibacter sp.]|nr:hypothetical protein [Segetibacter sp.]
MNEYEHLIKTLHQFRKVDWINQYFNLLKKLLIDLQLEDSDPRLALTLRKNKTLPVNIGQRYVLKPLDGECLGCIVPAAFTHEAVGARLVGYFSPKTTRDAKWIIFHYPLRTEFPGILFNACIEACTDILNKTTKSGFRKFHNSLLYHFTMEPAVRNEVLAECKALEV